MSHQLQSILSKVRKNYYSVNWWRNRVFVPYLFGTFTRFYPSYPGYNEAVHVMDEDWDSMIVLDACRADYFQQVADLNKYDNYNSRISLGSHSSEWTRRNFQGNTFADTVYVSANPHTSLEASDSFHYIYELWETDFDDEIGVVRPDVVRDVAIEARERFPNKRLIIHFMQPHGPFLGSDIKVTDESSYWQAYKENLEYTLPFVHNIIDAIHEKTVITADHGQAYTGGVKDLLGIGGHKPRLRFPSLVEVPWAVVNGDRREIEAGEVGEAQGEHIQDRLKDLGYF